MAALHSPHTKTTLQSGSNALATKNNNIAVKTHPQLISQNFLHGSVLHSGFLRDVPLPSNGGISLATSDFQKMFVVVVIF